MNTGLCAAQRREGHCFHKHTNKQQTHIYTPEQIFHTQPEQACSSIFSPDTHRLFYWNQLGARYVRTCREGFCIWIIIILSSRGFQCISNEQLCPEVWECLISPKAFSRLCLCKQQRRLCSSVSVWFSLSQLWQRLVFLPTQSGAAGECD